MKHKDEFHEPIESMCVRIDSICNRRDFVEFVTSSAGCRSGACGSHATQIATASEPATEKFVVHPAKSVEASLRLGLVSRYIDQTPGNAAVQYMRAALALADNKAYRDVASRIPDWLDLPLDQLRTHDDAQNFFNGCPTMIFDMIRFAANKDYCEWELPFREFNMETRIPELQWLAKWPGSWHSRRGSKYRKDN